MHSLFKALANEHRLKILNYLSNRDEFVCVCEMEDLIDRDRSVIYRHFRILESVGILKTRKNGRRVEGKIADPDKLERILEIAEEIKR